MQVQGATGNSETPIVTPVMSPQEGEMIFQIENGVQIFFIYPDGRVTSPSYPSFLAVFTFPRKYGLVGVNLSCLLIISNVGDFVTDNYVCCFCIEVDHKLKELFQITYSVKENLGVYTVVSSLTRSVQYMSQQSRVTVLEFQK